MMRVMIINTMFIAHPISKLPTFNIRNVDTIAPTPKNANGVRMSWKESAPDSAKMIGSNEDQYAYPHPSHII